MALEKYSDERIAKMSVIELAVLVLGDQKKEMNFSDLFYKVAELKELSESEKENILAGFYTDLNIDGRFMTIGSNVWGLKRWYPADQTTEKSLAESRKRDKKAAEETTYDEEGWEDISELDETDEFDEVDENDDSVEQDDE